MKLSEIRAKAQAWRQNELERRGDDWRYKPGTVVDAYESGYRQALEDVLKEWAHYRPETGSFWLGEWCKIRKEE